jgi:manganese efflux pump family protein
LDFITIFAIASALAMDTFAISIATGIRFGNNIRMIQMFRMPFAFGFFQSMMTVLGWLLGAGVKGFMQASDHWIALGLLVFIGGKMIYESFRNESEALEKGDPTTGLTLLALAVATSIDAFAVGLSFGLLRSDIVLPSIVIGLVTFAFALTGMKIGNLVGGKFGRRVEILGGVILILIGLRIFVQHVLSGV